MKKLVIELISFLFILLFVYAAITKLMDYEKFTVQLGQSPLLIAFASWMAWLVPTLELIISAMLAFPKTRLFGLYASYTLMVMFTVYIIVIMNFAPFVPCSCGGILEKLGWTEHLIFNIAFVILGISGIWLSTKKQEDSQTHAALTEEISI